MSERFYILEYANYPNRPEQLFCQQTIGCERKNNDETKFVVRCDDHCDCLDWLDEEGETEYTHSEILTILDGAEWNT